MSDSMKEAMKEGISVDETPSSPASNTVEGAKTVSPPVTTEQSQTPTNVSGAEPAKSAENEPFHKNPRWQKMVKDNQDYKTRLETMERKYQENLERIVQGQTQKVNPTLPDEQRQALMSLVNLIKNDPDASSALGLNQSTELRQELERMTKGQEQRQFNSELDTLSKSYAQKYGLKADELAEELSDYIETSPYFNGIDYREGLLEAALNNMLFPRLGEMKEREANLKLITEKNNKVSQNTETSSSGKPIVKTPAGSLAKHLASRIQEEGGISLD